MIQRIDSATYLLKPKPVQTGQVKKVELQVSNENVKAADYLYNPDLADKIHESRKSLKEEMGLLKDAAVINDISVGQSEKAVRYQPEQAQGIQYSALDTLKNSLTRINSLLYQLASVASGDSDSLEAIQRKLAEEISGYRRIFKKVDLTEFKPVKIDVDSLSMAAQTEALQVNPENATATRQVTEAAEKSVEKALKANDDRKLDTKSVTEANLSNAQQNLAAAESAIYPEEIVDRAKEVAQQLYEKMSEALGVHGTLKPDEVFKLIGAG